MKIGIASVDTTPPVGTYLGGFARMRDSVGVRDRLETTAVWVQSDHALALICTDLVFVHRSLAARVRARVRKLLGANVDTVIACSHSHATPYGTHEAPAARFQDYADAWVDKAVRVVARAKDSAVDGVIRWRKSSHSIGINRRLPGPDGRVDFGWNETGPVDAELGLIELVDSQGGPIGHVVSAAAHPIVLPPWSRLASADWVGEMRRTIRDATGLPCAFMQGGCADVNPRHDWVPRRFGPNDALGRHAASTDDAACRLLGTSVGGAALKALADAACEEVPDGPVAVARTTTPMRLAPRCDPHGRPRPYWDELTGRAPVPRWIADRLLKRAFPWKTEVVETPEGFHVPMDVSCARVGGLAIYSHGSEPFAETALRIKSASPVPFTIFAGYTDGMIGYVPTDEAIPRGGYEVETVPALYRLPGGFTQGSESRAVRDTLALAETLWSTH